MVEYVTDDIDIKTADGLVNNTLCLTASESWAGNDDHISIALVCNKGCIALKFALSFLTPFGKVEVDLLTYLLTTGHCNNA